MGVPPADALAVKEVAGRRPVVLSLLGAFWPGHDAAGPNQSYRALAQSLGAEFDFKVVARDRPFGNVKPLAPAGRWMSVGKGAGEILYLTPGRFGARGLAALLRKTPHDLLILNGFFDRDFTLPTLWFRRLGLIPRRPTLLSPRGELAKGALSLKSLRKRIHRFSAKTAGLLSDVWLHATSAEEGKDNLRAASFARGHLLADNLGASLQPVASRPSEDGALRLALVGRITRVKNIHFALEVLSKIRLPIRFGIIGPVSDSAYWAECQAAISALPSNVVVHHYGEMSHDQIPDALANFDGFILPTLGENFGHAIYEALSCGLPVIISDRTPWRDLYNRKAGWDLPLEESRSWVEAIEALAAMMADEREKLAAGARSVARVRSQESGAMSANLAMFLSVLAADQTFSASKARVAS